MAGFAVHVVVNGQDGYTAATYTGRDVYKALYGGQTLSEAHANRMALRPYHWHPGEQPGPTWAQARWEQLSRVGKHGHYEMLFRLIKEAATRGAELQRQQAQEMAPVPSIEIMREFQQER